MKLNEWDVLQLLKDGLIKSAEVKGLKLNERDFGSKRWKNSDKRVFYLWKLENNLFDSPARSTVLGTGAEAVRSSAAMIYNLLGENELVLDGKTYSRIEYEKPFAAIKDEGTKTHKAHLDAVFQSADGSELYAIEAKLLEWKGSPKNLAAAYLDESMYFPTNTENKTFIDFFNSLINQELDGDGRYKHKTKRYDAIQMTIHTLGLYNYFAENTVPRIKKLILQNVVWKYDCNEYETEEREAINYLNEANRVFVTIFKQIGLDFSIQYSTFQDFKNRISFAKGSKRPEYLKRYEV